MKKIIIPFVLLVLVAACKKDGSSSKKMYLSKVFINNLLSEEYAYSSDMQPVKRTNYTTGQGQSTYAGFRLYEYTDNSISEILYYNKSDQLSDKRNLSYNASSQLSRVDVYGSDNVLDYYFLFTYENDRVSKIDLYDAAPQQKKNEIYLRHDAKGNLTSYRRYFYSNPNWYLFDSAAITNTDRALPAHWNYAELWPVEFPGEKTFLQMPVESMFYYLAGGPPWKANHTFTEKVFNSAGYLTSQKHKQESDNAITITTTHYDLKYEYIE